MQRGTIVKEHGSWCLMYYDWRLVKGKRVRKRVKVKLARVSPEYKTAASMQLLADRILAPINEKRVQPESAQTVKEFIEERYFPMVERELRPSTQKSYRDVFEHHVRDRLDGLTLRQFQTKHGQKIVASVPNVGHRSLLYVKSFLSGVFKFAIQEGILDEKNPMREVSLPRHVRPNKKKGEAYTLGEIDTMLYVLPEPARTVIATAALTGLRLSELRGLRWGDFDGETLRVQRGVWRTHVGPTKSLESEAAVPVLAPLRSALERHRSGALDTAYIFAGEKRGTPLNLANLANRVVKPALKTRGVLWKGWHAFRRGLGSNLYELGVPPMIIQSILRHSDVKTTLAYYVRTRDEEAREAMRKLDDALGTDLSL